MQRPARAVIAAFAALPLLAACIDVPAESAAPDSSDEAVAQQSCLRDVRAATGNSDVSIVNSFFSEAGTEVNLRVGPTGTWRCIGYRDGTTAGIQSTTDEGSL